MELIRPVATSNSSQTAPKQPLTSNYTQTRIGSGTPSSRSDLTASPNNSHKDIRPEIGPNRSGHSKSADTALSSSVKSKMSPAPNSKMSGKDGRYNMIVPSDCSYLYTNYGKDIKYKFMHTTDPSDHMDIYR